MQWATIPGFSQGKTGTLTVAGWSDGSQTITVSGVTASGTVLVAPSPASQEAYAAAGDQVYGPGGEQPNLHLQDGTDGGADGQRRAPAVTGVRVCW